MAGFSGKLSFAIAPRRLISSTSAISRRASSACPAAERLPQERDGPVRLLGLAVEYGAEQQRVGELRLGLDDRVEDRFRLGPLALGVAGFGEQVAEPAVVRGRCQAPPTLGLGFCCFPDLKEQPGDFAADRVVGRLDLQHPPAVREGFVHHPQPVRLAPLAAGGAVPQVHAELERPGFGRANFAPPRQVRLGRRRVGTPELRQGEGGDHFGIRPVPDQGRFEQRLRVGQPPRLRQP
jgi:hypothetical protein